MSKKLEKKMEESVLKYKKCLSFCLKEENNKFNNYLFYDSDHEIGDYFEELSVNASPEKKYVLRVNFALSCMESRSSKILWKEYFFQIEKYWWMRYYARSTFYRLRKKAIEEFLCYLG